MSALPPRSLPFREIRYIPLLFRLKILRILTPILRISSAYESEHGIVRGAAASVKTATMFGEFYPNPTAGPAARVSMLSAAGAEALGTFLLVIMIFALTEGCNLGRPEDHLSPLFIGLTVSSIICPIAPLTQAGINPARDLGPRVFAWLAGWGGAAFPDHQGGFLIVYVLAPIFGGVVASLMFVCLLKPVMMKTSDKCDCIESERKGFREGGF